MWVCFPQTKFPLISKKNESENITPSEAEMSGGVGGGGGVKLTHLESQIKQTLDILSIKNTLIKNTNNRLWHRNDEIVLNHK